MSKAKYITKVVTLANGATDEVTEEVELDKAYNKVSVATHRELSTMPTNIKIGLKNDAGQIHDKVIMADFEASSAVAPKDRYKEVDADTSDDITIQAEPTSALAAEAKIHVVFKLEKV